MKRIILKRTGYDPAAGRVVDPTLEKKAGHIMGADGPALPALERSVSVVVPFAWPALSKNRATGTRGVRRYTTTAKRAKAQAISDLVALECRRKGVTWVTAKVWLDILVVKPDLKGDAINVLDTVADAVKRGIGSVDDRWFAIRRLDWSIDPSAQPTLYLVVGQEAEP